MLLPLPSLQTPQIGELIDARIHYGGSPSFSTDSEPEVATKFCKFCARQREEEVESRTDEELLGNFSALALATLVDRGGSPNVRLQSIQVNISYPIVVFQVRCIGLKRPPASRTSHRLIVSRSTTPP
jgi:hypothetical protein